MVGPFIFVDQFGPARLPAGQGMDVRPHPHINLATVTYLFDGAIEHRDSIGIARGDRARRDQPDDRGQRHRPFRALARRALRPDGPSLYGMQTWLALPDGQEEIDPAFEHVAADGLPLIEDGGARARVLMGDLWGATAATRCHSPTIYADIELAPAARSRSTPRPTSARVMLVGGEASARRRSRSSSSRSTCLRPGHAARLSSASGGRLMLLGGEAFSTPRHVFWNFVSSSRDRINQAKEDWKALRFAAVPGDDQEFIPLPEVPKTVSYP